MSLGKPMGKKMIDQISHALVETIKNETATNSDVRCEEAYETETGTMFVVQSTRKILIPDR